MDWLKPYTSILLMNILETILGKVYNVEKIISTSWILNRSVGQICRMDVFYYYICRWSNISQTKFSIEDNMRILFFCVSFASPVPPEV